MKWLVLVVVVLTLTGRAAGAPRMERTTDTAAVLALMTGEVDLYGDKIGTVAFQRGVLDLLRSGTITVRVLTSRAGAANMKPLKALGARVNTLPSRLTGALIVVRGRAVIAPGPRGYVVLRGPQDVAHMTQLLETYWMVSTRN